MIGKTNAISGGKGKTTCVIYNTGSTSNSITLVGSGQNNKVKPATIISSSSLYTDFMTFGNNDLYHLGTKYNRLEIYPEIINCGTGIIASDHYTQGTFNTSTDIDELHFTKIDSSGVILNKPFGDLDVIHGKIITLNKAGVSNITVEDMSDITFDVQNGTWACDDFVRIQQISLSDTGPNFDGLVIVDFE